MLSTGTFVCPGIRLLSRKNNIQIKKLNHIRVIKRKYCKSGLQSHPKTLPQHLHVALTAVATVHTGKSTDHISYYLRVFSIRSAVGNRSQIDVTLMQIKNDYAGEGQQ
jgi:hypothetical protein